MTKEQFVNEVVIFGDKMYRIAFRLLENSDSAKDVLQESFLKLWEKRYEIKKIRSIEAYVVTVIKNKCLDKLRLVKQNIDIKSLRSETQNPEPEYENKEVVIEIKKIIQKLPEQQKTIIELRDIEGLSYEEIAEILDMSVNNVRVHLSYARKKLKEELGKIYNYGLSKH
jgi:RNA polymerase sigma-70 factor (ECF subfamily)